jgi:Transposase DDE domain.
MGNLEELYCFVDDFCKAFMPEFEKHLLEAAPRQRLRNSSLSSSEIMTLLIYFHQCRFRDFKTYYLGYVQKHLRSAFPGLVSYNRFVELMPTVLLPLCFFLNTRSRQNTGIYFIDSTALKVCHVKRAASNKVFQGIANKGKSSLGWFFGFKLHLVINDQGELMAFHLTQANVDDRSPVEKMTSPLQGKLFGDRGYLSQALFDKLYQKGLQLITKIRKNMKNKLLPFIDKILLRKRAIIESVNDQLKNISHIEHSRHRSTHNFMVNLLAGLAAYSLQPKKPSLNLHFNQLLT